MSKIGKLFKFTFAVAGTAAIGYFVKKSAENDFQDIKDLAKKGKNLLCEKFCNEEDAEEEIEVEIIDGENVFEYEG